MMLCVVLLHMNVLYMCGACNMCMWCFVFCVCVYSVCVSVHVCGLTVYECMQLCDVCWLCVWLLIKLVFVLYIVVFVDDDVV